MEKKGKTPGLAPVAGRFVGASIEEALLRFESATSSEEPDRRPEVLERIERPEGSLVRYLVRYKHSVFDDHPYGSYEMQALVARSEGAAPGEEYRVVASLRGAS